MSTRRIAISLVIASLLVFAGPARADDDVKARIAAAGDAEKYHSDLVVVLDAKDVRVRPNGIGTARNHRIVKILRDGGIRRESTQILPFDPDTNRLDLIAIRIHRQDGSTDEIATSDCAIQPQTAWGIFWGTKQYLIDLPDLQVGDAVETITEMTGFNVAYLGDKEDDQHNYYGDVLQPPVPGHWHDEADWWVSFPTIEKRYSVLMPKDMPLQYEVYNGELRTAVTLEGDQIRYVFEKEDIEPLSGEPRMEEWPNVACKLLLATLPTWEDKARWLYEVSEPQFGWDQAIEDKVHEIIAGLKKPEEIYTALNHWVADNVRYAGTSRGMCEGYTIHKSVETFHDRCGVCKDKAGMLVTMLRVAGFDSFLVMTMARQRVDRIPADQFNHAVTCIRWDDGSLKLLDPTWMPNSRDNWSTLEPTQHVVYGLPEGGHLGLSPYFTPEECQATWQARSKLGPGNVLRGELDFNAVGTPEGRIRRTLSTLHPKDRHRWFDRTFQRLSPNAEYSDLRYVDPFDYEGPLKVRCNYEIEDYAVGGDELRMFKLPMLKTVFGDRALYDLFGHTSLDERKYGMELLATRLAVFEETVELPTGWTAGNLPDALHLDGPSASLDFEIEVNGNQLTYTCKLAVKKWTIPPEDYANFKEVIEKFEELSNHMITCEAEGSRA